MLFLFASEIGVGVSRRIHRSWVLLTQALRNTAPVAPLSNNKTAFSLCFFPLWLNSSLTFTCIEIVSGGGPASLNGLAGLSSLNILG